MARSKRSDSHHSDGEVDNNKKSTKTSSSASTSSSSPSPIMDKLDVDDVVVLRKKHSVPIMRGGSDNDSENCANSDSNILVKNKSSLFLIKSYSFIDKVHKSQNDSVPPSTTTNKIITEKSDSDLDEFKTLLLETEKIDKNDGNELNGIMSRPKSVPATAGGKRESFFRQSLQNIRRSFVRKSSSTPPVGSLSPSAVTEKCTLIYEGTPSEETEDDAIKESSQKQSSTILSKNFKRKISKAAKIGGFDSVSEKHRSTSSVVTVLQTEPESCMAPLQNQSDSRGHSVIELNTIGGKSSSHLSSDTNSNINYSTTPHKSKNNDSSKSIKQSVPLSVPSTPVVSLSSSSSINSYNLKVNNSSTAIVLAKNEIPEKEKKRKELSSSRQKKFHRHFQQVSKDEKVINYFSCALVSDILLQGHLYITENHFAFYSNVFGFITKVVIPTSSVIKISKEKVAKIIPNAVGVATLDERHVFGSFMSRESAFRLMCSVCPPLLPIEPVPKVIPDVEKSEECSVEDDSSCSISGNESPLQQSDSVTKVSGASQTVSWQKSSSTTINTAADVVDNVAAGTRQSTASSVDDKQLNAIPINAKVVKLTSPCSPTPVKQQTNNSSQSTKSTISNITDASNLSTPISVHNSSNITGCSDICNGTHEKSSSIQSSSSSFKTVSERVLLRLKFPTDFHIVYLGVILSIILALFSGFLLYRILDIEAKTSFYKAPIELNWQAAGNNEDIFAKALRWQRELQSKSTEEAQIILNNNLEQIAKVRRSLETLSMLIHDRSTASSFNYIPREESYEDDTD